MRRALDRVFQFYWGEGIADDVPALAYYLVLSLAPFALGVAAVALRLDDALTALSVAAQINRYLPEQVHGDVERERRQRQHEVVGQRRDVVGDALSPIELEHTVQSAPHGSLLPRRARLHTCSRA